MANNREKEIIPQTRIPFHLYFWIGFALISLMLAYLSIQPIAAPYKQGFLNPLEKEPSSIHLAEDRKTLQKIQKNILDLDHFQDKILQSLSSLRAQQEELEMRLLEQEKKYIALTETDEDVLIAHENEDIALIEAPILTGSLTTSPPPQEEASIQKSEGLPQDFALDLGVVSSIKQARALWENARTKLASDNINIAFEPRIVTHNQGDDKIALRLLAGPIKEAHEAAKLCAQLTHQEFKGCMPSFFYGQKLDTASN